LTRAVPLSLMLRGDLAWLLPPERASAETKIRANAGAVLEALTSRGALFYHDLAAAAGLLAGHLDEALLELAQLGMVTSDGVAPLRALTARMQAQGVRGRRRRRAGRAAGQMASSGRWSLFPGTMTTVALQEALTRWAWQLLSRWGVVFRDLLQRETAAPSWGQLVPVFRRLEARGEIRGGRFVADVGGEQYAAGDAVDRLRQARDREPTGQWLVVAGSDPLNLEGIVTRAERVGAKGTNSLALRDGHFVAALDSGVIRFATELAPEAQVDLSRRLRRTG
jgi:ATP-dependent Lhr-like helicase